MNLNHTLNTYKMRHLLLSLFLLTLISTYGFIPPPSLSFPGNNSTVKSFEAYLTVQSQQGVSVFQFQYDTSNTFNSNLLSNHFVSGLTYYRTPTLRKGKTYHFRARAIDGTDTSAWSTTNTFNIFTTMENLSPTNLSSDKLTFIRCSNVVLYDTVKYLFEMDTVGTFNSANYVIRASTNNILLDSQYFRYGRKFFWRASAINKYNDTLDWSSTWSYTINKNPGIYNIVSPSHSTVVFQWPTAGSAESLIQIDTTINFNSPYLYQKLFAPGKVSDTLNNLFFGKNYYYRVKSVFAGSSSNWSLVINFKVLNTLNNVSPYNKQTVSSLLVNFSWERIKDTRSQVQVSSSPDFSTLLIDSILTKTGTFKLRDTLKMNTKYYWRIRAMHLYDTLKWQNHEFSTFKGEIFQNLPMDKSIDQNINVKLIASKADWARAYFIEIDTGKTFGPTPSTFNIKSNNVRINSNQIEFDTVLNFGTQYVWRVFGILNGDTSRNTYFRTFKTIARPSLNYPYNTMTGVGTSIEGLMDPLPGSTHVIWQLDTTIHFNSSKLISGKDTHLIDKFANNKVVLNFSREMDFETRFYWRARCLSRVDSSDWSVPFNFISTQRPWINSPANHSIIAPQGVELNWGVQGSVNDYVFQYQFGTDSNFLNTTIKSIAKGNSSKASVSCSYGTTYYWRGRALHSKDTSSWSITSRFTTESMPLVGKIRLTSPANLTLNLKGSSTPLKWLMDSNAVSYDVQVSSDTNCINILTSGNTSDEIINFTGMEKNTTYYWRVRGKINNQFVGPWSDVWRFSTEPNPVNLNDQNTDNLIQIYPNPSNDVLNVITKEDYQVQIINALGQMVLQQTTNDGMTQIDVSRLSSGCYTLILKNNLGLQVKTIYIQH